MSPFQESLLTLRSFIVNFVVWIFIILVYGPFLCMLVAWRYLVNFLGTRLHSDFIPCSPNDTLLVHETPDVQPILTGGFCLKVRGQIDENKLLTLFEELFLSQQDEKQLKNYQNLYCDFVKFCGYLFKRKIVNKIKLENHFCQKEMKTGDDFKKVVASWFQEKFQKGLPLWQMLVLTEDGNAEVSYFCFKAHHILMDGYSFVHILDKLTGVTSPGEWVGRPSTPENNNKCVEEDKSREERYSFWKEIKVLFSIPEVVASFTFPNLVWTEFSNFPESKPLSNFEMLPMSCGSCSLGPIKEIRRKLGVHFPAIVYALQAGVIRAALLDGCSSNFSKKLDGASSTEELPKSVLISASLPVLGREHPRNKLTNHWSGGYIKVPLKSSSAKERVLQANKSLDNVMKNDGTYIVWKYMAFLVWLIPSWIHTLLEKSGALNLCKYRSSMSCIPQSCLVQYNLMGLPVENIFHAPVMKDSFINAVLLGCSSSHHEQVDFSLFGHPDWFPTQERMDKAMEMYMRNELEALAKECDIDPGIMEWKSF